MRTIRAITAGSPTRAVLVAAVWLAAFAYAGRPLPAGAAAVGLPAAVGWLAILVLSVIPAFPLFTRRAHFTSYTVVAIFSTLLVLVFVSDVLRGVYFLARWAISAQTWPLPDPGAIALTILGAAAALSFVGLLQAMYPRVQHVKVAIDELPPELEGYRIVQLSDVHVGPTIRRRFVQSLVDRTNALHPDLVAITGDLVDGPLDDLRDEVAPLRELRARDGVFFVTGNHEYYWHPNEWLPALESLDLILLKNEHRVIDRGAAKLVIAGVTDPVGRDTDPARAVAGAPPSATKILLSHRPHIAKAADTHGVHLQLSGHTHGGQIWPFTYLVKLQQPYIAGLHRHGDTQIYVSPGTGYWGPPMRLGTRAEITRVTLHAG
jgi:predicted MPP superfamily phosphohydrolase